MAEGKATLTSSPEAREFIREELTWLTRFLMRKHRLNAHEARSLLRETLDLSV